jgi:hypothetical protein
MTEFIIPLGLAPAVDFIARASSQPVQKWLCWTTANPDEGPSSFDAARDAGRESIPFAFT